jgi:hypothetical protein
MKTIAIIITIQISIVAALQARIGDTPEQSEKRYLDSSLTDAKYQGEWMRKDGIITRCFFAGGKCVGVIYDLATESRVIIPDFEDQPNFTEDQVLKLLALNGGKAKWKKTIDDHHGKPFHGIYVTEDGKLHALVNSAGVSVETTDYRREMSGKISKSSVDATISGFGVSVAPSVNTHAGKVEKSENEIESEKRMADLQKSLNDLQESVAAQERLRDALRKNEGRDNNQGPETPASEGSQ